MPIHGSLLKIIGSVITYRNCLCQLRQTIFAKSPGDKWFSFDVFELLPWHRAKINFALRSSIRLDTDPNTLRVELMFPMWAKVRLNLGVCSQSEIRAP